jgi:hypothetical protein
MDACLWMVPQTGPEMYPNDEYARELSHRGRGHVPTGPWSNFLLERDASSSRKLYDALEGVQTELGSTQPQQAIQYVEALHSKMSGPTLESVLDGMPPTTVSVRPSVRDTAALMKEHHTTAPLVQDHGSITGIFTMTVDREEAHMIQTFSPPNTTRLTVHGRIVPKTSRTLRNSDP